ncbi:hypothetical protein MNBD_GAMMA04-938 [hydrothermal vent metagenome]|uniref:DUF3581 domain-containing protein n=1 Tax=hydrothermal vent metagenome TaxID=652676 RepID=A0A3B0WY72_9ZZZZ
MYLTPFYSANNSLITITPEQGSAFAKNVSDDFNPLHNPDSKRFCVPGDLLFSIVLARLGLSQNMSFHYTGMVGKDVTLIFPDTEESQFTIIDDNDKAYLNASREGRISHDITLIEQFSRAYVAFSGHSFPHILVPLMKKHDVMINPDRPMVIYESMAFELDTLALQSPTLELSSSLLEVNGKRGLVRLEFDVLEAGKKVGSGFKTMVLSGLREYDQTVIDHLVARYEQSKQAFFTDAKID